MLVLLVNSYFNSVYGANMYILHQIMSDQWVFRFKALVIEFSVCMGVFWYPGFVCSPGPVTMCRCHIMVIFWPRAWLYMY